MDEIVRKYIVEQVSEVTNTQVKLDAVKLDLKEGVGSLFNFEQPNPPGFQTKYAFHFDQAELDLDLKSIFDEVIIIEKVFINGAEVVYEHSDGKTNFIELKNIINANMNNKTVATSTSKTDQPQQKETKKTHAKQSKKIIIKSFEMINTKVEGAVPFASSQYSSLPQSMRRTSRSIYTPYPYGPQLPRQSTSRQSELKNSKPTFSKWDASQQTD